MRRSPRQPDFATTYPPHCLRGTHGAEKVAETRQADPVPLALTESCRSAGCAAASSCC